jgi:hypothetical protein
MYLKCVIFLYCLFAWSLLIPATNLDVDAANLNKCLSQNSNNITKIQHCLDSSHDWEIVMIIISVLLFFHNSVITLLIALGSINLNLNCIKHNTNLQAQPSVSGMAIV